MTAVNAGVTCRMGRIFGRDGRAMILPVDHGLMLGRVPGAAGALPIKALAEVLEDAYTPAAHAFPAVDLSILLAWAVAGSFFAAWRFRRQAALDTVRPATRQSGGGPQACRRTNAAAPVL